MNSIGHRGVTLVTIVTLLTTPMLRDHRWPWHSTGKRTRIVNVKCVVGKPCPHRRVTVSRAHRKVSRADLRTTQAARRR